MARSNPPPGVTAQDLARTLQTSHQDLCEITHQHLDRYPAKSKDGRTGSATIHEPPGPSWEAVRLCTYPARPVNGGSLERALPKAGQWHYEPRYNGWRALVHVPTRTMFSRYGQPLTIAREFSSALSLLQQVHLVSEAGPVEWFDCEALERRHALGQGTLLVFDYIVTSCRETYLDRKTNLTRVIPVHDYAVLPRPNQLYSVVAAAPEKLTALAFYRRLKQLNQQWRCPFYEGVIAKRADSTYPVQLRSPTLEYAGWVKHRWVG